MDLLVCFDRDGGETDCTHTNTTTRDFFVCADTQNGVLFMTNTQGGVKMWTVHVVTTTASTVSVLWRGTRVARAAPAAAGVAGKFLADFGSGRTRTRRTVSFRQASTTFRSGAWFFTDAPGPLSRHE